jgi:putative Holliday junction resolvase
VKSEKIVGIVIGLPLYSDGSDSDTTKQVRAFAAGLAAQTDLPIIFCEENLTSIEAEENIKNQKSAIRNQKSIDSESARIILENAIAMIKRV